MGGRGATGGRGAIGSVTRFGANTLRDMSTPELKSRLSSLTKTMNTGRLYSQYNNLTQAFNRGAALTPAQHDFLKTATPLVRNYRNVSKELVKRARAGGRV